MNTGVLFRGGKLNDCPSLEEIESPKSIVNLRKVKDPSYEGVVDVYSPAPDSVEVYDVSTGYNQKWIIATLNSIIENQANLPLYIHCAAGKDRTGVIVASILGAIGIQSSAILDDYFLSKGLLQPKRIQDAVDLLTQEQFYRKVDVRVLKKLFLVVNCTTNPNIDISSH